MAKKVTGKGESKEEKPKATPKRKAQPKKKPQARKPPAKKRTLTKTPSGTSKERYYGVDPKYFFKPRAFSPTQWGEVFLEYLEDRHGKAWYKNEAIKSGDFAGTLVEIPSSLPLSIESFCVYAGVSTQTFYNYEKDDKYKEYFDITSRMRGIIEADQLDGATVGAYNHSIIARRLGLMDKVDLTTKGKEIEQSQHVTFEVIKKQKTE